VISGFRLRKKNQHDSPRQTVEPGPRRGRRLLAWAVHLYTALGLVAGAGIAVLIVRGGPASFRAAFALMIAATLIDATDGALARAVGVKKVLPGFDGRRLDDIIDFLTYTCLPLLLIWRADLLPEGWAWCLFAPLLASAYGFCQTDAKTPDGYFLGFPSYWNIVALYLYVLQLPPESAALVILTLSILTFVPIRYLYPSQGGRINVATNILGAVWTALWLWIVWRLPKDKPPDAGAFWASLVSLFFPVYYFAVSWIATVQHWHHREQAR
jgi:phosphatidylcholine synthase